MSGLQIRINGQAVDLSPETKVELELVNPFLVYETVLSSKATIPALPATRLNRIVLGFPELLQTDEVGMRYDCEKYYNGQLLQAGVAILTEASETFALTVVQAIGEVFGDLQYETLSTVDLGAIALPAALEPVVYEFGRPVVAFPVILNDDFYGSNGAGISYNGHVNDFQSGAYTASGPKVPMVFLPTLLERIQELTGVILTGSFMEHPELQELLLYNTRELASLASVKLQEHLPELTIPELLLELRKVFNLAMLIEPSEKTIRLDFTDSYLERAAGTDWSRKALKAYKKRPETNRRLQLGSLIDSGDGLAKDKPDALADYLSPPLEQETGLAPLTTKFSTLLTDPATGLAITKQAGISERFGQLANKFGPRLLFWNGIQNGPGAESLPTATAKRNGYSLYWPGADGLAARFWPGLEAMRKRMFYVERALDLDELDLATLDFSAKYHINGVDYLVAKINVSLPIREPSQVLLVRV